jgi:PAS domain S-box-containing protein
MPDGVKAECHVSILGQVLNEVKQTGGRSLVQVFTFCYDETSFRRRVASGMISYQLRQREYLLQISRAMTSRLELPSLLNLILGNAADMVRAEAGLIALHHPGQDHLTVEASYGIPNSLLPLFAPLLEGFPKAGAEEVVPDLQTRLRMVTGAIRLPLNQVIALPLTFEERLLGVIYLFRSGSLAFTSNDRSVLVSFADQAAIAVRNAQLYQQLSAEKQQLDAVIQHSADGVMILDPSFRILVFNQALSHITGWPRERAIGQPCYQVIALENSTGGPSSPDQLDFGSGDPIQVEGLITRPGGARAAISVTYTPLYDDSGQLATVIGDVIDITRFREAEEMKSTFISVVSHELKTPVALIKGYANTLAREDAHWDEATARESLQVIEEEADRLNTLINELLDASRIQAGAFKIELGDVDIIKLAKAVVEGFGLQTKVHHFVVDFPPNFPILNGDERRLRQVLNNLVSNAIKYAPQGGEIRVGGWAEGHLVTVYVADQGIGIPAEEQSLLFQRFFRLDSSLTRSTQGTGLGLYLSKSIIEAHGGRIWLRSEPGKGTTVFFSLPAST